MFLKRTQYIGSEPQCKFFSYCVYYCELVYTKKEKQVYKFYSTYITTGDALSYPLSLVHRVRKRGGFQIGFFF